MSDFVPTESDYKWLEKHCIRGKRLWLYKSGRGYLVHNCKTKFFKAMLQGMLYTLSLV